MLRVRQLRGGLSAFFLQFLVQSGLFFTIPLFLSVALGLSAIDTGLRLMPLSITLLLAAAGIPKLWPHASPRRVSRLGFLALFVGIVSLIMSLEAGAGAEIVTGPLLLAGLGIGALASQLGSVTVASVPDEQSGEVGGLQNTFTQLGASIGTALAGAVLISALTASFFSGLADNPDVPDSVTQKAQTELSGGIPFVSDAQLEDALQTQTDLSSSEIEAVVDTNADARIEGLRTALAVLALVALVGLFFLGSIPTTQPGDMVGHDPDDDDNATDARNEAETLDA